MLKIIRNWIISCEKCIREKRIDNSLIRPPLQNPNEFITGPEDALQTFKNITNPSRENLEEIFVIFRQIVRQTAIDGHRETQIPEIGI